MAKFLLEVGLEEIPARMIAGAEAELSRRVAELLTRESLLDLGHSVRSYSTPRRLAVLVEGVLEKQQDREETLTGPAAKIAFKDGQPTPAAHAFAKKAGVDVADLKVIATPKGDYLSARVAIMGKPAAVVLAEQVPRELAQIYWAKNMYWRAGKPERFVRPVQWLLALLEDAVVPMEFAGVAAGHMSRGHRILHGEAPVAVAHPDLYLQTLQEAFVLADVPVRRQRIRKALDAAVRAVPNARWREDGPLVETVAHLTEWPSVALGTFEHEYLSLPEEVLVTVMRDHQKYFAVEDGQGKLAPFFLTVLNIAVDEAGLAIIRHGNARVLRARFNDARFFWDYDQKVSLNDRVALLRSVTFQKELGSYYEKTEANRKVAAKLAESVPGVDKEALDTAMQVAKADLTSELVKEFTELQGIVGGLYARAQGLGEKVALAIYSQYRPASMEDRIPTTIEGQLLGLSDRMQTISAMFAIGLVPTGSKDPFALRRAANGVIKILAESTVPLTLEHLVNGVASNSDKLASDLYAFLRERLEFYLRDARGFRYDIVNAVLATRDKDVRDAVLRAESLNEANGSEDFIAVSAGFKRIKNILRQADLHDRPAPHVLDTSRLKEPQEIALHKAMQALAPETMALEQEGNYAGALGRIATLRPAIDAFFDKVMVMDPDEALRRNRLVLIHQLLESFSQVGDLSEIISN